MPNGEKRVNIGRYYLIFIVPVKPWRRISFLHFFVSVSSVCFLIIKRTNVNVNLSRSV